MHIRRRQVFTGLAATAIARHATAATPPDPYQSAGGLVQALADAKVSSRELTDAAIARIEALDPKINAVVVRDFARAREAADAADAALARGERRPLLGLPMTVKEQFNVAGLPTTWGYEKFRDWRAPEDALAVRRLKAAGAVILGKTNVPVGLGDWQSYNPVYGQTNNPWDVSRSPGGSSGGAAAALAAGFVPLEMGSDLGGSLRAPAHFCGVFAHKPTLDLIPQRGSGYPGSPAIPVVGDMSVIGPMARTADDLVRALDVLAGPDELWDGIGYTLSLPTPRHERLADYRVLVIDQHPLCATAAAVRGAIDKLADGLQQRGCTVLRAMPDMPNLAVTTRVYDELLAASFSADLTPEERVRDQSAASALAPENQGIVASDLRGSTMTHPAWIRTTQLREGLRARWQALFREIDVIVCPPMPTAAFPHDHAKWEDRQLDADGRKIPYTNQVAWCAIATPNGFPATVAPLARTDAGLPVGVQIVGGHLDDRTTIAFAALIEQEFGGFVPPPAF
ncbi:MAG: amidase [Acetobacteraceae bacterium]|nr:amidase [Acetobacteraceae bacterium]